MTCYKPVFIHGIVRILLFESVAAASRFGLGEAVQRGFCPVVPLSSGIEAQNVRSIKIQSWDPWTLAKLVNIISITRLYDAYRV